MRILRHISMILTFPLLAAGQGDLQQTLEHFRPQSSLAVVLHCESKEEHPNKRNDAPRIRSRSWLAFPIGAGSQFCPQRSTENHPDPRMGF